MKIDGVLRGRGVEFDGFVRDMAKDVDPDRPLAADRRTLEIMGADGLPAQPAWNRGRPHFNGPKVSGATPRMWFDEKLKRVVKREGVCLTQNEREFLAVYCEFTQKCVPEERAPELMNAGAFSAPEFEDRGGGMVVGTRRLSDGRVAKAYFNFADECREADGIFLPPHFARLMLPDL